METLDPAALAVWDMGRAKGCCRIRQLHSAGICLIVPEIPNDLSFFDSGSRSNSIPDTGKTCGWAQMHRQAAYKPQRMSRDSTDKHPGRNMIAPGPVGTPKKTMPDSLSTTGLAVSMDLIRTQL